MSGDNGVAETTVVEVTEAVHEVPQGWLQAAVNLLIELPYGRPVPGHEGVVAGDVVNALRNTPLVD